MDLYPTLIQFHSLLRWLLLLFVVASIVKSAIGLSSGQRWGIVDHKLSIYSLIMAHLQLVLGLVLYFISPVVQSAIDLVQTQGMGAVMKDDSLRFWLVEHFLTMLAGIILITIGRVKAKKATDDRQKHRAIVVFFLIGLILILSRVPWPWMEVGRPLF
ncbi:MAG: cytochrome B [Cyclobacteriaceae bacterium]